jgi:1,4-dihydroxy-2-naphthoate octaprenyltransferase
MLKGEAPMLKKAQYWITELRAPFLTATIGSIILGTIIAWTRNDLFNLPFFVLAFLGGVCAHLGTNVANDYYDHKSGNDEVNREFVRPFSGGSRTIQQGLLTPREVLGGALLFFAIASSIGVYLSLVNGPIVLALALVGLVSGFFYTAPPFNWASKGAGEALVGVNFGALMTLGAYYVQTRTLSLEPLVAAIPLSLLIAAVLYINEFPDYVADKAVGKRTLVVRLGRDKAAYGYAVIVFSAYVSIVLSALFGVMPAYTLLALMPLPLAVEAVRHVLRFHSESLKLVPANAVTITLHLMTSLLVSVGYLMHRFVFASLGYIVVLVLAGICALLTLNSYFKIRKAERLVAN